MAEHLYFVIALYPPPPPPHLKKIKYIYLIFMFTNISFDSKMQCVMCAYCDI